MIDTSNRETTEKYNRRVQFRDVVVIERVSIYTE